MNLQDLDRASALAALDLDYNGLKNELESLSILAAKIAGTDNSDLADEFLAFILTDTFQNLIPTGNWSLPAALPVSAWPEAFQELPLPEKVLFYSEDEAADLRAETIEEWRRALSK